MGFLGDIFGGAKDILFGESASHTTLPQTTNWTPEQMKLLSTMLGYYTPLADKSVDPYTGERVAGMGELQTGALSDIGGISTQPLMDTVGILSKFASGERGTPQYLEDYYQTNIEDPLMKKWKEDIMPTIGGEFNKKGLFMGSGRRDAELDSATSLMETLGKGRADLYSQMEQISTDNQFRAIAQESQTLADILGIETGKFNAGEAERGIAQAGLDTEYADWLRTQPGSRPQDAVLMSLLGLSPYNPPDTVVDPGSAGLAGPLIQAGGMFAAASAMAPVAAPSSRRWKHNITDLQDSLEKIKKLRGVSFNWNEAPQGEDKGFIAEEVGVEIPELINRDSDGIPSGVKYIAVIPMAVEAIKELSARVEVLEGGV